MARARLFFYRYGFASVLIGRFLGPIRSTIPTVAGVMGMAHGRFQLANVSSAILWMPLMLAPGYVTARSLGSAENAQQIAMLIGAGFSVLLGVGLLVAMLRKKGSSPEARRALSRDAAADGAWIPQKRLRASPLRGAAEDQRSRIHAAPLWESCDALDGLRAAWMAYSAGMTGMEMADGSGRRTEEWRLRALCRRTEPFRRVGLAQCAFA